MAIKKHLGCTIVYPGETPQGWICFDPKIVGIDKSAAGGYYEQLQCIAMQARLESGNKYTIDLHQVGEGLILLTDNLAVESSYDFSETINKIIRIIDLARI